MDREEAEKRRKLESLTSCIQGANSAVPKDLERIAEIYDKNKKNVAKAAGYHPQDINIYTNPFNFMRHVLDALVRMPSAGKGSLLGKEELKRFLRESVKKEEIDSRDAKIIIKKYIHYRGPSYRRSDRKIDEHEQAIKLFLNDRFLEIYEKFFGK